MSSVHFIGKKNLQFIWFRKITFSAFQTVHVTHSWSVSALLDFQFNIRIECVKIKWTQAIEQWITMIAHRTFIKHWLDFKNVCVCECVVFLNESQEQCVINVMWDKVWKIIEVPMGNLHWIRNRTWNFTIKFKHAFLNFQRNFNHIAPVRSWLHAQDKNIYFWWQRATAS